MRWRDCNVFFRYLAYTYLVEDFGRVSALLLGGLSFVFISPLGMMFAIIVT